MLRAVLLACLAACAVATFRRGSPVGGSIYEGSLVRGSLPVLGGGVTLDGILQPADVTPAIRLIRSRYGRISRPASIDIIRLLLGRPNRRLLRAVHLRSVPVLEQRLPFLNTLVGALPPVFYASGYRSGLASYLGQLGVTVNRESLLEPLALVDARLAGSLLQPVSVNNFVDFFGSQVLQVDSGVTLDGLPPLHSLYTRLASLRLNPVPLGFQRISLSIGGAPGLSVVNPLQPALNQLGLVNLVEPQTVYSGLTSYLTQQQLPVAQFVGGLSRLRIPSIPTLVRQVPLQPLLPRLSFLPVQVIERDIVPLLLVRFYTLPRRLTRTVKLNSVVTGYLSSLQITEQVTLSPQYIVTLLTGFDQYIHNQFKGFRGRLWCHDILGEW